MSNEPTLQTNRSLELLGRISQTASQFAVREEQAVQEFRSQRHALDRKYRGAVKEFEATIQTQVKDLEADLRLREESVRAAYESRRNRIQKAESAGVRSLPKKAQQMRARYMGDLQMRKMRMDRKRQNDLNAAAAAFKETTDQVSANGAKIQKMERRAGVFFGGYPWLRKLLKAPAATTATASAEGEGLTNKLNAKVQETENLLGDFRQLALPRMFSYVPVAVLALMVLAVGLLAGFAMGGGAALGTSLGIAGGVLVALLIPYFIGAAQAGAAARRFVAALSEARHLEKACAASVEVHMNQQRQRIQEEFDAASGEIQDKWTHGDDVQQDFEAKSREKLKLQAPRAAARNVAMFRKRLQQLEDRRLRQLAPLEQEMENRKFSLKESHESALALVAAEETKAWEALQLEWRGRIEPLYHEVGALNAARPACVSGWDQRLVDSWSPPTEFTPAVKFGRFETDAAQETRPKDSRLALPGASKISVPLALGFPGQGSLLIEANEACTGTAMDTLNNIILRLLVAMPPGKVSFTILDPVGLGQNFAGLMHLSDYEEALINRRIWTQRDQIEERLAELNEHIEKVIQMYLRNEYETITEYNEQAGSVAEKYHFLVVADFPANFGETAVKRLQSIAMSGPRCGVFTLIHWDRRQPEPEGFVADDLRKGSVVLRGEKGGLVLAGESAISGKVLLDAPPNPDLAVSLVHKIGKASIDSNRVEVPFSQIAPKPEELWTSDTTSELRIAIGRTGATKLQYLAIGKGTRQHALFAGKTGSGKSTLFHVIITNLALACSPDQVEFYLIDFKKGVEFKCYASSRLPHARVVAIESDREFGLSVLQRVDEELRRRGDMFRKLGVQDIAGYKKAGGTEPVPRSLLIIDEFQEFFVEDDQIAQNASVLFDRIVRQGRAFGIHVLLGSQTLGGAYTLARATLGQMVIRVALQCNEADAYLIMDENNPAPRLLSRPGEGIYNDAAGAIEGNSPFQVVWLNDEQRDDYLHTIHRLAQERHDPHRGPIVFEGNSPADIRENYLLQAAQGSIPAKAPAAGRIWLGAPNSIKGPTEAAFHRQSGNHLLIVGQRDDSIVSMLGISLVSLAAQYPAGTLKLIVLHAAPPEAAESQFLDQVAGAISHPVTIGRIPEMPEIIGELADELKDRSTGDPHSGPAVFVFIHGLHKFKKLRGEDDFSFGMGGEDAAANPATQLTALITEGSSHGIHLIATVDTYNNVGRFLNRKAQSEFEMRVVFQMSANDSASLIDSPKAGNLGLHRALLFNEHEGTLETFRPYAQPERAWLEEIRRK
ncbi:MAG: ATP-binding protein [Verrucomicrobiales bacterium]|nr:ATP-binding protein [Verrucomicrobiales bacterium]